MQKGYKFRVPLITVLEENICYINDAYDMYIVYKGVDADGRDYTITATRNVLKPEKEEKVISVCMND